MKVVTCFVKTGDTGKDFDLLSESEKIELASALQQKALRALAAKSEEACYEKEDEIAINEEQIQNTQEE